jgi:uncharacterized protein YprB with RNaseH-like and TPR domain
MKRRAYLDIETTGLNCCDCDLTVNGNRQALRNLLAYSAEDVVNLRVLRRELGVR